MAASIESGRSGQDESLLAPFPSGDKPLHDFFEELRKREYDRLDHHGHTYLDYTGGGLYGASQLAEVTSLLASGIFGNPHSVNPSSLASTELVDETRRSILTYFNANEDEYEVVFTQNASGALKLVGESFPFGPGSRFVLAFDNHNSVNGIREFANKAGAEVEYVPLTLPELRLDDDAMRSALSRINPGEPSLLAYPAQSNFSGVQHDLCWIQLGQDLGWTVLLDAAAYVPTNRLDLSAFKPDFISISFYKMFGLPTGVGALIAKRASLANLERPWFGGGTISLVSVQGQGWHRLLKDAPGFEDGTLNYLAIPGVDVGLRYLSKIGIDRIHERVTFLTESLLEAMCELRHNNGKPLVQVLGPEAIDRRGGTIAFNLFDPEGDLIKYRHVELLAARHLISLRTGCFCNPGAGETAHHLTAEEMRIFFTGESELSFDEFFDVFEDLGKHPSTVRVSVGIATSSADLRRFIQFLQLFLNHSAEAAAASAGALVTAGSTPDTS